MTSPFTEESEKPVCFVLMPIADVAGYEPGHFGRVYEHLLKPAILAAGYKPIRADDAVKTDYIVVGIIQKIVESAMVLCDFSGRNPNVMYELGVRHAFNKPVVLIKDRRTEKIFDIQGLRHVEYDESLRIDAVHKDQAKIKASISETATAAPGDLNSIVQLAGIIAAEVPVGQTISADTKLILATIDSLSRRIEKIEDSPESSKEFFTVKDGEVHFGDLDHATVGEQLFVNGELFGRLLSINQAAQTITIGRGGRKMTLTPSCEEARLLSTIPF